MLDRRRLSDRALGVHPARPHRMLPEVTVLKVGGQSVMDRGAQAVLPVVEQIKAARSKVPMIVCTGAGTRARHAYHLALDLGLAPGIMAKLGGGVAGQNARMLTMLLSEAGSVLVTPEEITQLPGMLAAGMLPVMSGMPPFEFWLRPPASGRVPEARTDAGVFLIAETLGAKRLILVKDEDAIYDNDPKKHPDARPVESGDIEVLRALDLPDLPVERILLDFMRDARTVRELRIVSALVPGQLTAALEGADVGARMFAPPR